MLDERLEIPYELNAKRKNQELFHNFLRMKKTSIFVGLLSLVNLSYAQFVTSTSTLLSASATSEIAIKTTGDVSIAQDLPPKVDLELSGSTQSISENLALRKLSLSGNGVKLIRKNLKVTEGIDFILGILFASSSGKILFTGAIDGIKGGNDNSYVDGFFYNQNTGSQIFPVGATIGSSGLYAPATILSGDNQREVGIQVVGGSLTLPSLDSDVKKIDPTHYWEVKAPNVVDINSRITLSLFGVDQDALIFGEGLGLVVVQAADNSIDPVEGLGSSSYDNTSVTSQRVFTKSFLAVGASEEVIVSVIDIITPKMDDHNDYLRVLNIEKFDIRKVKLLDRYGFVIKEWKDFTNYDDPNTPNPDGFDFTKLGSGSYICIVEYGDAGTEVKSIQQMVSVIKN